MKYETTQRKIQNINRIENQNKNAEDNLQKIDLNNNPENILKTAKVIHLIQGYNFPFKIKTIPFDYRVIEEEISLDQTSYPVPLSFYVDLPNFPEWAIPFTKIIPKVYMDDAYDPLVVYQELLYVGCRHFWKYIGENHWRIGVETYAVAKDNLYNDLPIYIDIDLVILNENVWESINSNKV